MKVFATPRELLRRRALDIVTPAEGRALLRTRISPLGDVVNYVARDVLEHDPGALVREHAKAVEAALETATRAVRRLLLAWRLATGGAAFALASLAFMGGDLRATPGVLPWTRLAGRAGVGLGVFGVAYGVLQRWVLPRVIRRAMR